MTKEEELKKLKSEMEVDSNLPFFASTNLVFGEGAAGAEAMFIGEAPGYHEDRLGRPFVGMAGKLLDELIAKIGWKRETIYITNIVKRRPPENRDPLPDELETYRPYLARQIEIINPKMIVALGRFAMNYFLPEARISRDQGGVFRINGRLIVPVYHPAAALRSTAVKTELEKSFLKLPEILGKPPADFPEPEAASRSDKPLVQNQLF